MPYTWGYRLFNCLNNWSSGNTGRVQAGKTGDDAWGESFFAILENDIAHWHFYPTREQARQAIFEYIEVFHNRKRVQKRFGCIRLSSNPACPSFRHTGHLGSHGHQPPSRWKLYEYDLIPESPQESVKAQLCWTLCVSPTPSPRHTI